MSRNMNRRFFAELLTVLSVQMVDKDELGSDECLIGDVLVKFKVIFITTNPVMTALQYNYLYHSVL